LVSLGFGAVQRAAARTAEASDLGGQVVIELKHQTPPRRVAT